MKMDKQELSKEWIELVKEAMKSNTSKEKFKNFLEEEKKKREYNKKQGS
ncbi:anti-repressor SinI family protein [Neobacillus cucumis]|nr:anti-repressor SinI family protein [Neobacillus cucumis]